MKRIFTALLLLVTCSGIASAATDWYHAVVQYKNGEKKECQSEYIAFGTPVKSFKIRRDASSKPETVYKDSVDFVAMEKTDSTLYVVYNYPYVNCKKYLNGNIKLVNRNFLPLAEPGFLSRLGYTIYGGGTIYAVYLKRQDMDFAIEIAIKKKTSKAETDAIRMYINDYEELYNSLEGKRLTYNDVCNLVLEYNQWKKERGGK